jgi:DNA repair exonuclease SbcCD nuclease subunit
MRTSRWASLAAALGVGDMRFVHSSDLQIGKAFALLEPEVGVLLQNARQEAVTRLGEIAVQHEAFTVLLAGDIFDKQQLSNVSIGKPIEVMRRFSKVTWHLMPGNHDHVRENGIWDRLVRMLLPTNVRLHTTPGAVKIADDGALVYLLPAPLRHISSAVDLTGYMDTEVTPDGAIRIGMAHGSVRGFGPEGEASNYILPTRVDSAGLAYMALGDWHRQIKISDRVWYSGTPEPDSFKLPPNSPTTLCNGGSALVIEIAGPRATPGVRTVETGRYHWHQVARTLTDDAQVDLLDAELRALHPDLGKVVLDLQVSGTLSLAGRKCFEKRIVEGVRAAICGMRLDDAELVLEPTETDMDEIDRLGFVRVAADRLKAMANNRSDHPRAQIASLALKRLYLENIRQAGRA